MANPIRNTPALRGVDAKKFIKQNSEIIKVSAEEAQRIRLNYNYFRSIATFAI